MAITTHMCRGNFRSSWVAEGGYDFVAEALFNELEVDGFFLEYDDARSGGFEPLRFVPPGKRVVLGLVTTKRGALEDKDDLKRRIDEAARFVPLDQLCLSPQCGFSSTVEGNAPHLRRGGRQAAARRRDRPRGVGLTAKQNRVTPLGDLVAVPLRGAWTGNRGNLHRGTEIVRFHGSQLWIICALEYKDQRLTQWAPGRYTLVFFHDEAVALAAGHRPCALCRRPAYNAYRDALVTAGVVDAPPSAAALDKRLHAERLVAGTHRRRFHELAWPDVPTGSFVLVDGGPALVVDDAVVPWTTAGYGPPRARPRHGLGHRHHPADVDGRPPRRLPGPDRPRRPRLNRSRHQR